MSTYANFYEPQKILNCSFKINQNIVARGHSFLLSNHKAQDFL